MALKFNKATDSEHKIKLDSSLISCMWQGGTAPVGHKVKLQVVTSFVGTGAKIKITGKTENGKKLGKISDKIRNNKFVGELEIPEKAKIGDLAYFEVELPKNSLSGESNRIPIVPTIEVSNMEWSSQEVRRQDILTLTADVKGCPTHTEAEIIIYEFNPEGAHDKITKLPAEIIDKKIEVKWEFDYHQSTSEIVTENEIQKYDENKHYAHPEFFFTVKIDNEEYGKEQESGLIKFIDWFNFQLLDDSGNPFSEKKYLILLPDGTDREGTLNEIGQGSEKDLPPGKLTIILPESGHVFGL